MQEHQIYQNFVVYLNQTIKMLNSMKSSLYDILNISIKPMQNYIIQPSMPSITAHCKKTMDDLKRITSILRGYSKSKNQQRQDENYRMSRFNSNDSLQRQSEVSVGRSHKSSSKNSRFKNSERGPINNDKVQGMQIQQNGVHMVTFQIDDDQNHHRQQQHHGQEQPQLKEEKQTPISKLKAYRSVQDFHKHQQKKSYNFTNGNEQCKTVKDKKISRNNENTFIQSKDLVRSKRARTLSKQIMQTSTLDLDRIKKSNNDEDLSLTQSRLIKCLVKQETGINDIIQRNGQCLTMLKQIHQNLKKKKLSKKGGALLKKSKSKSKRINNSQLINKNNPTQLNL